MSKIQTVIARAEAAFSSEERHNQESQWSLLSEYMLNNQHVNFTANSNAQSPGQKKTGNLFDSTSLQAVQDLASAFQGTLTNPATVWSQLRFQDDELNNDEDSTRWLEDVNRRIHNGLSESNFSTEIAKGYQSFVSLGNMAVFFEEDSGFRFKAAHIAQIAWEEDKNGLVSSTYRKLTLTAKQALEKWGPALDSNFVKAAETNPNKRFEFYHAVFPRSPKEVRLNEFGLAQGDKRPVASLYIDIEHGKLVEESGYYEMPLFVARWSLMPHEVYGRGPGHLALPDTRTLNRIKQRGLEAVDLQVRPPVFANQRDVLGSLDLRPGSVSVVRDHSGIREFASQARADVLQFSVNDLQQSIRSIFFLDKLLLPPRTETGEMTAFEVSQRIEQMHRVLGPTLSRLNHEVLNPLVVRAFKILLRSGTLPETPALLKERGIDVEIVFVNQLARAQQMQDVNTIQQWLQNIAQLAQLSPEALDLINSDGIAKHTGKILGVPEVAIKSDQEVQAIRQQRQEAAQQEQALEGAMKVGDAASKLR